MKKVVAKTGRTAGRAQEKKRYPFLWDGGRVYKLRKKQNYMLKLRLRGYVTGLKIETVHLSVSLLISCYPQREHKEMASLEGEVLYENHRI